MRVFELQRSQLIPLPRDAVFAFFSDPGNLERITPPWLSFRILSAPPDGMKPGARIRYRLRVHGVPLHWVSEITAWDPPHRFVDTQIRGPYRKWIHEHTFLEEGKGTRVGDRVRYAVPGGWLVDRLLVRRDVARIFDYRSRRLWQVLVRGS